MKKSLILTFLIISILLTNSCCLFKKNCPPDSATGQKTAGTQILTLDESSSGQALVISMGDNISINLKANPSTGYTWAIIENDEAILPLVSREFIQNEAKPGMVGVGGTLNLTFKGIKPGRVKLILEYSKPLAGEGDTVKNFELEITVK